MNDTHHQQGKQSTEHDGQALQDSDGVTDDGFEKTRDGPTVISPGATDQGIGDESLSATWDTLEDGGTITISTDGTHDFGDEGPILLFRQTFKDVADGDPTPPDTGGGRGEITKATGTVEAAPDLPYGKGLVVGDGSGKYRVKDVEKHDEFYEHYYIQWPAAHQDAAADALPPDGEAGWQIKGIWHFLGDGGYSSEDANDLFSGSPLWYSSGGYWTGGAAIASNSIPTSTFTRDFEGNSGMRDPDDATRWRSEPTCKQLWVKCGPTNGEAVGSDGMSRNASVEDGELLYNDYEEAGYFTDERADETGFDQFTAKGYTRGFDYDEGYHAYFGDIYQTVGPGAAARVEVTDSDVYRESRRLTAFTVQSWSGTEVTAEIVEGIFHDDSLVGNHLWLTDADNESHYVGQLQADPSVTASGETIALGGTATLSLDAQSVERVTVGALWTGWDVQVADDGGAEAIHDRVSEAGEFVFEWGTIQEHATPSLSVSPRSGTYVGGTYIVTVVAEGGGGLATDTAIIEISDGTGEFAFSAADGISADGTFTDGSTITVQDDAHRFGTKSTQAPHMFDRQTDGQLINGSEMDAYSDVDAGELVPIGHDDGYPFDSMAGDLRLGDPRGESAPEPGRAGWYYAVPDETDGKDNWLEWVEGWPGPDAEDPPKPRRQVYISWLLRSNWNLYTGDPFDVDRPGKAAKVHRIWADADNGDGYRFSWTRMHAGLTRVGEEPGDNVDPYPSWEGLSWNDFERWHHMEVEIDYRDGGYTRCYVDGELLHDISIVEENPDWVGSISPRLWGYNPSESDWAVPEMVFELADYYVDSSLARVVLTNAESWANSDRRVTQPPFSWQDDELEFELYQGVLADHETIYLWVVDENGEPTRVGTLTRNAATDVAGTPDRGD